MVSNQAERNILTEILNNPDLDVQVRLFKNNPGAADDAIVLTDLEEADFDGYAPVGSISWPIVATNGSGQAETLSPTITFERTAGAGGSQDVYGIYMTFTSFDATEKLLWHERFDQPFSFGVVGQQLEKKIDWKLENLP